MANQFFIKSDMTDVCALSAVFHLVFVPCV